MLDRSMVNAAATFFSRVTVGSTTDAYGDSIDEREWYPLFEDVGVRYDPRSATTQQWQMTRQGDAVSQYDELYAPLEVAQPVDIDAQNQGITIGKGDRISLEHAGRESQWRIDDDNVRTIGGTEGYVMFDIVDLEGDNPDDVA